MRHVVASALFAVLLCPIAVFAIDNPHDEVNPDRCLSFFAASRWTTSWSALCADCHRDH